MHYQALLKVERGVGGLIIGNMFFMFFLNYFEKSNQGIFKFEIANNKNMILVVNILVFLLHV